MTPELTALATLVALQIVFGLSVTGLISLRTGAGYILSSREQEVDLTTGFIGRMHRARINNFEALAYFTPAVAIVTLSNTANETTAIAAWVFIASRLAFIAAYALDLAPWRSIVWLIGIGAVATMVGISLL